MTDPRPLTHIADMAAAHGHTDREAMLLAQAVYMHELLLDVVRAAGGEIRLPPGSMESLEDRIGTMDRDPADSETIATVPDEETGEFVVTIIPTPEAYRAGGPGPGLHCGSFWERFPDEDSPPGPRHRVERVDAAGMAELRPLNGGLTIFVEGNKLLKGLEGWRRA